MDFSTPFGQEVLRIGNLIDSLNKSHQDAKNLDDERYSEVLNAIIRQVESMRGMLPNKGKLVVVTETKEVKVVEEPVIVENVGGEVKEVSTFNRPFAPSEQKSLADKFREEVERKKMETGE